MTVIDHVQPVDRWPGEAGESPLVRFFVTGIPIPQGSKMRTGFRQMKDANETKLAPWRDAVIAQAQAHRALGGPLVVPLQIDLAAYYPRPKSHYGTGRNADRLKPSAPGLFHAQKPDADKVARAALDALVIARLIGDDSIVAVLTVCKSWAARIESPGLQVTIWPILETDQ